MIKSVYIKNFKNHVETFVELDTGINIISGSSHNGKSALLKAMYWCLFNKPDGLGFKRLDSKGAVEVRITFDDGSIVERKRSKTLNEYNITYPNGETKTLKALGRGTIPEEVSEVTQMNEINFQTQFSEFFLLHDSGGAIAKQLNAAVGMGEIDKAIKNAASIVKKANKDADRAKDELKEISEELSHIPDLTLIKEKVVALKELEAKESEVKRDKQSLDSLISQYEVVEDQLYSIPSTRSLKRKISEMEGLLDKYRELEQNYDALDASVKQLGRIEQSLLSIPKISGRRITKLERMLTEYKELETQMKTLDSFINEHERTAWRLNDLEGFMSCKGIVDSIDHTCESYVQHKKKRDELDSQINEMIDIDVAAQKIMAVIERGKQRKEELVQEAGGICPICEKPMGDCDDSSRD